MMNLDNYYMHGTAGLFGLGTEKMKIVQILNDGKILTRNSMNKLDTKLINDDNEICLVDSSKKDPSKRKYEYLSAFDRFIVKSPSLVLSKDLPVYEPTLYKWGENGKELRSLGGSVMYDEVRHKGDISLDYLEFVTFPVLNLDYSDQIRYFQESIELIKTNFPEIKILEMFSGKELDVDSFKKMVKTLDIKDN